MNRPYGLPGRGPLRRFEAVEARGWLPPGYIGGLTLSNDTTDATNDLSVAAGACRSSVNVFDGETSTRLQDQVDLSLPIAIIKQLDVSWAPENYNPAGYSSGGRSGGRSASAISNTTWHVYAVGGFDVPTDILLHDSATQSSVLAALPNGYTAYRRIGSVLRSSAALVAFVQFGNRFDLVGSFSDVSVNNPGTSAATRLLSVPLGISVEAIILVGVQNNSSGVTAYSRFTALDMTAETPADGNSDLPLSIASAGNTGNPSAIMRVRTNTSGQIRSQLSASDANVNLRIRTLGWIDPLIS